MSVLISLAHICQMLIKYMRFRIKNITNCLLFAFSTSLVLFVSTQNTYAGYAELDPGLDIMLEVDLKNKKRFYNFYNKSILLPLINGDPVKVEVATPITPEQFFRSRYCYQLGEYLLSGSINLPTWCNKNYGPLRGIRFNPYALIVPITVKLDRDYTANAFNLLENQIRAKSIGTIKHAKYNLSQLSDYSFRNGSDLMLGIVNQKLNKMQLFRLDGFDTKIENDFDSSFTNIQRKDYEIRIELVGANGRSLAGVNVTRNGFTCKNHHRCISKDSHHLEFTSLDYAPKLLRHQRWGLITNDILPPYYLSVIEEGGFHKIFLSRSFLLILDLDSNIRQGLKGVRVNVVSS